MSAAFSNTAVSKKNNPICILCCGKAVRDQNYSLIFCVLSILLFRRYSAIGSSAEEGSSRITIGISRTNTLAITTFCDSPLESIVPSSENSFVSYMSMLSENFSSLSTKSALFSTVSIFFCRRCRLCLRNPF